MNSFETVIASLDNAIEQLKLLESKYYCNHHIAKAINDIEYAQFHLAIMNAEGGKLNADK